MIASLKKLLVRGGLVYFSASFLAPFVSILVNKFLYLDLPVLFVVVLSVILYLDCIWLLEALTRQYFGWELSNPSDTWTQTLVWTILGVFSGVVLSLVIVF